MESILSKRLSWSVDCRRVETSRGDGDVLDLRDGSNEMEQQGMIKWELSVMK